MNILINSLQLIIVTVAFFIMPACSLLHTTPESLDHDLNLWLSQHQYDKIDYALQNIDKNNKEYKFALDKIDTINIKKNKFIETSSAKAQKYKSV